MRLRISFLTRRLMASPTALQRMAIAFVGAAIVLVAWMVYLGETLHNQATFTAGNWGRVWIGLDTMEALALAALGVCLVRRDHRARTAATVAATLFAMDAWFDVLLSQGGSDFVQALVLAVLFEIPLALCCAGIARQAARWYDL